MSRQGTRESNDSDTEIVIVVVESHQHALEHIHGALRRRARLHIRQGGDWNFENDEAWTMLHFDSHPDLGCPGRHIPAAACFLPRKRWPASTADVSNEDRPDQGPAGEKGVTESQDLYELLDRTPTGISEWILPLVLAGELREVHWVKRSWSDQFRVGRYCYHVGASVNKRLSAEHRSSITSFLDLPVDAVVHVNLNHPYYIDEQHVVSQEELLLAKPLTLVVSEMPAETGVMPTVGNVLVPALPNQPEPGASRDWILDICLDYFICCNPFITDLMIEDMAFAEALCQAFRRTRFHGTSARLDPSKLQEWKGGASIYEKESSIFRSSLENILRNDWSDKGVFKNLDGGDLRLLNSCYASEQEGKRVTDALLAALSNARNPVKVSKLALDALPNMSMPHQQLDGAGDTSRLNKRSMETELAAFEQELRRRLEGRNVDTPKWSCPPLLVTIARSVDDGFTPSHLAEELQEGLLRTLQNVFCGCSHGLQVYSTEDKDSTQWQIKTCESRCRFRVVRDYGEWEGSSCF